MGSVRTILIDPGHGGHDSGAFGNGLQEAALNLAVAQTIADDLLSSFGVLPVLTRQTDRFLTLKQRVEIERYVGPALFLSIHCNGFHTPDPRGFEVWTSVGQTAADDAASFIAAGLRSEFPGEPFREDWADNDPDKEEGFYVLKKTRAPAVLIELGFLSNPLDAARLGDPSHLEKLAHVIAASSAAWAITKRG